MKKENRGITNNVCVIFLSLLLALSLLFAVNLGIFMQYAMAKEEKRYCTAIFEDHFAEDKIVVIMNDSIEYIRFYTVNDFLQVPLLAIEDLTEPIKEMLMNGKSGGLLNREHFRSILRLTLQETGKQKVLDGIKLLEKRTDILSAEPDYAMRPCSASVNSASGNDIENWGLNAIQAAEAWKITTGSSSVRVGVIDSGIDKAHIELQGRVNESLSKDIAEFYPNDDGANNPFLDGAGHGTHVAGIIGATGNNKIGINKNIELVSLKVKDDNSYCSQVISAVSYAIADNIPILNNSIGYFNLDFVDQMKDAMVAFDWILYNYKGLFVTCAGNENEDSSSSKFPFPATISAPNLIVVGALDHSGRRWVDQTGKGSNYGAKVDIYAPGANIISTISKEACARICGNGSEEYKKEQGHVGESADGTSNYHSMSGTSMAAPHVTGVAALMLSVNPDLTGAQLKTLLLNNSDSITIEGQTAKKLNAYKAVASVYEPAYKTKAVTSDTVEITGIEGYVEQDLIIPESIQNKTVVSIGQNAFYKCESLKTLTFASNSQVQTIGVQAFAECKNLTSVTIPTYVTKIDIAAFIGCANLNRVTFSPYARLNAIEAAAFGSTGLTEIELPSGLTKLGASAFNSCASLKKVTFKNRTDAAELGQSCFDNTPNDLKLYVATSLYGAYVSAASGQSFANKFVAC